MFPSKVLSNAFQLQQAFPFKPAQRSRRFPTQLPRKKAGTPTIISRFGFMVFFRWIAPRTVYGHFNGLSQPPNAAWIWPANGCFSFWSAVSESRQTDGRQQAGQAATSGGDFPPGFWHFFSVSPPLTNSSAPHRFNGPRECHLSFCWPDF